MCNSEYSQFVPVSRGEFRPFLSKERDGNCHPDGSRHLRLLLGRLARCREGAILPAPAGIDAAEMPSAGNAL